MSEREREREGERRLVMEVNVRERRARTLRIGRCGERGGAERKEGRKEGRKEARQRRAGVLKIMQLPKWKNPFRKEELPDEEVNDEAEKRVGRVALAASAAVTAGYSLSLLVSPSTHEKMFISPKVFNIMKIHIMKFLNDIEYMIRTFIVLTILSIPMLCLGCFFLICDKVSKYFTRGTDTAMGWSIRGRISY